MHVFLAPVEPRPAVTCSGWRCTLPPAVRCPLSADRCPPRRAPVPPAALLSVCPFTRLHAWLITPVCRHGSTRSWLLTSTYIGLSAKPSTLTFHHSHSIHPRYCIFYRASAVSRFTSDPMLHYISSYLIVCGMQFNIAWGSCQVVDAVSRLTTAVSRLLSNRFSALLTQGYICCTRHLMFRAIAKQVAKIWTPTECVLNIFCMLSALMLLSSPSCNCQ